MSEFVPTVKKIKKDEPLFLAGSDNQDLYVVKSGAFLVCVNEGSKVSPLNVIEEGEYIGEFAFFDGEPRSAHVICLEDAEVVHIPYKEAITQFPSWMRKIARSFTRKIRNSSELIREKRYQEKKC